MNKLSNQNFTVLYFGDNQELQKKLVGVCGGDENCVGQTNDLKEAFKYLKENPVDCVIFETFQVDPFLGLNDTDLDLLIYYNAYEEGKNKQATFLPIDPPMEPSENNNALNVAQSYYEDLYEKHLFLLPAVTLNELSLESFEKPDGMDLLSNLVGLLDEETNKLDERLETSQAQVVNMDQAKGEQEATDHNANLGEEVHKVKGHDEPEDSFKAKLSGDSAQAEEVQLIKGAPEEKDDHKETISGTGPDVDSAQLIKGTPEEKDDHKETISGAGPDVDSAQLIKGTPEEKDDHKETISGAGPDVESSHVVESNLTERGDDKEIIFGEKVAQGNDKDSDQYQEQEVAVSEHDSDDFQTIISGEQFEQDKSKTIVKGTSPNHDEDGGLYEFKKIKKKTTAEHDSPEPQDLDQRNNNGQTPVMVYAMKGDTETVKSLISNGAKVDLTCHKGKTLLHYASEGTNDLDFIKELIDVHGLKATKRDSEGRDPLYSAITKDHDQLIEFFLDEGARINTKYKGEPILHVAAHFNALRSFKTLLLLGADLKSMNGKRENIITYCKKNKKIAFLKLITAINKLQEIKKAS